MQYQPIGPGIRGFYRVARSGNLAGMNTHPQYRLKVLHFLDQHGLAATCDAFAVSRRTRYRGKAALCQAGDNPTALIPRSSVPKTRRKPDGSAALVEEIRHLRTDYPNLGKAKVQALLGRVGSATRHASAQRLHHRANHRQRPRSHASCSHPTFPKGKTKTRATAPQKP